MMERMEGRKSIYYSICGFQKQRRAGRSPTSSPTVGQDDGKRQRRLRQVVFDASIFGEQSVLFASDNNLVPTPQQQPGVDPEEPSTKAVGGPIYHQSQVLYAVYI